MARQQKKIPKKRGRPATGLGLQINVRLQPETIEFLDDWISTLTPQPSRPEAIRGVLSDFLTEHTGRKTVRPLQRVTIPLRLEPALSAYAASENLTLEQAARAIFTDWLTGHGYVKHREDPEGAN